LTQAHDGGEQAIREIAQQMILRSKAARDATAAKVVMQKPDEVPLIQQPTPGGGVTLTPAPGIPVTKKPPTKEEDDIAMRNLRAKKIAADAGRGPSLTAAEDDQLAAYDQGKNVTTSTQDEELDAYAKLIGKPNRQALTYQDRQTFARNAAKIRADADFQQHIAQRNYDIKNPLHDPNDTLVKVEHQDANGRTVVEYLPRSDVKGKTFDKPVSAALANRLASAKAVNQTGDDIIAKLSDPAIAATVGPVMGRFNTLRDFLGNPPPELAELAGAIESYSLANMGVHGMRSAEGAAKINQMLNEKGTPASLIAKIKGLQQFSAHLLENEGRTVPTVPTATTPTTAPVVTNPFRR
jgi:hypothetical protein